MALKSGIDIKLEVKAPSVQIVDKTKQYESLLVGKNVGEAADILSRVDSSISSAHTLASQIAVENAYNIFVSRQTEVIRNLILRTEILQSHTDFLYTTIIPKVLNAKDYHSYLVNHKKEASKGISILAKLNSAQDIISKRYPHPINSVVGGVLRHISEDDKSELIKIYKELGREFAKTADFIFKNLHKNMVFQTRFASLYEIDSAPLISNKVLVGNIKKRDIRNFIVGFRQSRRIMTGPIARINNNSKLLSYNAERLLKKYNLNFPLTNPYLNLLCMAIECVHLVQRTIEELGHEHFEHEDLPVVKPRSGKGFAAVESAKGTLYHEYSINSKGVIKTARIISNIEQNHKNLLSSIKLLPIDPDKKTRKEIIEDVLFLIDSYYL